MSDLGRKSRCGGVYSGALVLCRLSSVEGRGQRGERVEGRREFEYEFVGNCGKWETVKHKLNYSSSLVTTELSRSYSPF